MAQRRRRQALRTNSVAVTSSTGSAGARVFQRAAQKVSYSSFSSGWTQLLVAKSPNLVLLREDFALPSAVWGPEESLAFSRLALIWDSVAMVFGSFRSGGVRRSGVRERGSAILLFLGAREQGFA